MKTQDRIALMNRLKTLLQTSKKAKITAAVVTFMMVTTSASALYSVRDVAVYRKLVQQIQQYKQMIEQNKDILMMFSLNVYPEMQFLIDKDDFLIGRKIDLVNGYIENQDVISKIHARIIRVGNNFFIKDEESLNGTYLNDKKINEYDVRPLKIGDIVKLANIEFKIK